MIDIGNEELVPMRQVPAKLPPRANGKHVHATTVYRWINHGVRGVKLKSLKVGGTTYTSTEALQRFTEGPRHPATSSSHAARLVTSTRSRELLAQCMRSWASEFERDDRKVE